MHQESRSDIEADGQDVQSCKGGPFGPGFSKHVLNFAITSGGGILPYNHFIPNPIRPQFWGLIIKILMLTL